MTAIPSAWSRVYPQHMIERTSSYRLHVSLAEPSSQSHFTASHGFGTGSCHVCLQILEVFGEWLQSNHAASAILSSHLNGEHPDISASVDNHVAIGRDDRSPRCKCAPATVPQPLPTVRRVREDARYACRSKAQLRHTAARRASVRPGFGHCESATSASPSGERFSDT